MTEDFLHHLWKFRLMNKRELATVDGYEIEILKPGQHNTDAGPDFFNARLKIGDTLWAGNVEIHLKSSDWKKHKHSSDPDYNNVILHVVYEHDEDVLTERRLPIPTLELKERFNFRLFQNYDLLLAGRRWIPCAGHIHKVDEFTVSNWLERLTVERLESKTITIHEYLKRNNQNWEETFYHHLARNFGFRTNSLPFEMLARALPLAVLAKHKDHLNQVEALLFGQAGMLDGEFEEDYPNQLKKEFVFLAKKFSLKPPVTAQWKFLRLRPSNFPTIRISQFAQLIHRNTGLFSKMMEAENVEKLYDYFECGVSDYWLNHYTFGKPSVPGEKRLGKDAIGSLFINTLVPFLFAFGKQRQRPDMQQRALDFLERFPPERNSVIESWEKLGITSQNAGRTQALLQLKNEYCDLKKCLLCSVGNKIINSIP